MFDSLCVEKWRFSWTYLNWCLLMYFQFLSFYPKRERLDFGAMVKLQSFPLSLCDVSAANGSLCLTNLVKYNLHFEPSFMFQGYSKIKRSSESKYLPYKAIAVATVIWKTKFSTPRCYSCKEASVAGQVFHCEA